MYPCCCKFIFSHLHEIPFNNPTSQLHLAPQLCGSAYSVSPLSGPTCSCFPSKLNLRYVREKTEHVRCIFSFAVATHHVLREIRVNHQNIKEADIYLECSCVCVCVFSVFLIIVFTTFHSWSLPLPPTSNTSANPVPICGAF